MLTRVFCQRWNNEGYLCQSISIVQNLLLPIEHRTSCVLWSSCFFYKRKPDIDLITVNDQHTIAIQFAKVFLRSNTVVSLPACSMSLLSEQELRDQLVSRCPVHPGWRPTSTGQPKDSRNSKKWGWTLDADSTFLRIYSRAAGTKFNTSQTY